MASLMNDSTTMAMASILALQQEMKKGPDSTLSTSNSPLLMLANMHGKDALLANVILGSEKTSENLIPNFEQVHALATASLVASTQRDIARQLEEESNADLERERLKTRDREKTKALKKRWQGKQKTESEKLEESVNLINSETYSQAAPKVFTCSVEGCLKKFATFSHAKYHELAHANDRQFKCDIEGCGKRFLTAQRLKVHLRTHTGERPFKCRHEECGKSFNTAGNLKNHQRIHTGERPFVCEETGCNRSFAEKSSLTKHRLTHTGDKPFECELCHKRFTQSGSRRLHLLRHELDGDFSGQILVHGKTSALLEGKGSSGVDGEGEVPTTNTIHTAVSGEDVNHAAVLNEDAGGGSGIVEELDCSPQVLVLRNSYQSFSEDLDSHVSHLGGDLSGGVIFQQGEVTHHTDFITYQGEITGSGTTQGNISDYQVQISDPGFLQGEMTDECIVELSALGCDTDFIGAEVVAISQQCDHEGFTSPSVKVHGDRMAVLASSVDIHDDRMTAMDPMMEWDEEPKKSGLS